MKILRFLLLVTLVLLTATSAFAATNSDFLVVSHQERSTELLNLDINSYDIKSSEYLISVWHSEIKDLGGGIVEIYGYTQCKKICNVVEVELVLQKWTGSYWQSVDNFIFKDYYTDKASGVKNVAVESGEQYRVKSYHYAEDSELIDTTSTNTDGIIVE